MDHELVQVFVKFVLVCITGAAIMVFFLVALDIKRKWQNKQSIELALVVLVLVGMVLTVSSLATYYVN